MQSPFKINIGLKIFLGYFLLVGLAAWFVLTIFVDEVKPGVRQAMEDTLVDTANVLAELATEDVKAGAIQTGNFAKSLAQYQARDSQSTAQNQANIWGVSKKSADYRVYIVNKKGIVIFDSQNLSLGQDYSQWNDVYLTLRGQYGVRSSPVTANDEQSDTIMYVAAPIRDAGNIIGSLTVAKPNRTLLPFVERAQAKIIRWGALLLVLSIAIGALFTWRFTRKINALRDYAIQVAKGEKTNPPTSSNDELTDLAKAMQTMRDELDGKQYVQNSVEHLTHELKSPITAIQATLELISPDMPADTQARFLAQIKTQSVRVQTIIQNMLGLASLEHQQQLEHMSDVNLSQLIQTQISHLGEKSSKERIHIDLACSPTLQIKAEPFLLGQAIHNVLENALDFSLAQQQIHIRAWQQGSDIFITVLDQGTGIPDYALTKIFDKFYSLPRPTTHQKSTGLGLNFVQEIIKLHNGSISIANQTSGGVMVSITLPA
jgi:two-component system, OmpR family, sensor histidine kinase CreC